MTLFTALRVLRARPACRQEPFLKFLGFGVEHPYSVAAVFTEPEAILRVHHAATRPRAFGGSLVQRNFPGLRVYPADMFLADIGEIGIILRIGNHIVYVVPDRRLFERLPGFPF